MENGENVTKRKKKKTIEVVRALRAEGLLRMEALDLALP